MPYADSMIRHWYNNIKTWNKTLHHSNVNIMSKKKKKEKNKKKPQKLICKIM
jgi:hypothetical protein